MMAHARVIEKTPAKYPLRKTVIKTETLSGGVSSFVKDGLFEGRIPNRVVLVMVKNTAYSGTCSKNPFLFEDFGLNFRNVSVNVDPLNTQPLKPSFGARKNYITNFLALCKGGGGGVSGEDETVSIDRDDYDGGYAIFVFDLVPDPFSIGTSLIKGGNLRLELQFGKCLAESVILIIYGEFSGLLEIDQSRSVQLS